MPRINLYRRPFPTLWLKLVVAVIPIVVLAVCVNRRYVVFSNVSETFHPGQPSRILGVSANAAFRTSSAEPFRWIVGTDTAAIRPTVLRAVKALRTQLTVAAGPAAETIWWAVDTHGNSAYRPDLMWSRSLNILDWPHLTAKGMTLWQRPDHVIKAAKGMTPAVTTPVRQYASLPDFYHDLPNINSYAVVNLDPLAFSPITQYQPATSSIQINHVFRGASTWYIYAANEDLVFTFKKTDLNIKAGSHALSIRLRRADADFSVPDTYRATISAEKKRSGLRQTSQTQTVEIKVPHIAPGMYRLELSTSDDVVISGIETMQHVLGLTGTFMIADNLLSPDGLTFSPLTLKSTTPSLTIATKHETGLQTVDVDGKKVQVKGLGRTYTLSSSRAVMTTTIPKGDLVITTTGLVTPSPATPPSRAPQEIDIAPGLTVDGYDYILAAYTPVTDANKISLDRTYPLADLSLQAGKATFDLKVPGLRTNGAIVGWQSLQVTHVRGSFPWAKITARIKKILHVR